MQLKKTKQKQKTSATVKTSKMDLQNFNLVGKKLVRKRDRSASTEPTMKTEKKARTVKSEIHVVPKRVPAASKKRHLEGKAKTKPKKKVRPVKSEARLAPKEAQVPPSELQDEAETILQKEMRMTVGLLFERQTTEREPLTVSGQQNKSLLFEQFSEELHQIFRKPAFKASLQSNKLTQE